MPAPLQLETFDTYSDQEFTPSDTEKTTATFEEGYAAGLTAAEQQFAVDQAVLREELVTTLREAEIGYASARADLIAAVQPLHDALTEALLPNLLVPGLILHLRELISDACAEDLPVSLTLTVPVGEADTLRDAVAETDVQNLLLIEDPNLGPHAVHVATHSHETALDLDAALAAIAAEMEALRTLQNLATKVGTHG